MNAGPITSSALRSWTRPNTPPRSHFFETVAVNRGYVLKAFTREDEALEWLLGDLPIAVSAKLRDTGDTPDTVERSVGTALGAALVLGRQHAASHYPARVEVFERGVGLVERSRGHGQRAKLGSSCLAHELLHLRGATDIGADQGQPF